MITLTRIWNNEKFWKIYCRCVEIIVPVGWILFMYYDVFEKYN